jgi:hypothetical protein
MRIEYYKKSGKVRLTSDSVKNQLIGVVNNGVFLCKRDCKHIFRKLKSIGVNKDLMGLNANVYKIEMSNGITYSIDKAKIFDLLRQFNAYVNYEDEKQIHLPLIMCDQYDLNGNLIHSGLSVNEFSVNCSKLWHGMRIKK